MLENVGEMQGNTESTARVGQRRARGDFARKVAANESGFRAVLDVPLAIATRLRESRSTVHRITFRGKLILIGLAILGLLGCAHNPPPSPPPSPPPPTPTVAKAKPTLHPGDWIIRNCQPASDNSCYCHHPAEAIDAGGQQQRTEQQHTVIECR
jgi:hypothetical protein